jgi:hypothetical protein
VRHFASEGVALGRAVAWLYALNAIGAAAGAWFTGMVLLPEVGLASANFAAAALSAAVGVAAWSLGRERPAAAAATAPLAPTSIALAWRPGRSRVYAAAALSGAAALALQMLWARDLVLVLGGTTYAYNGRAGGLHPRPGTGSLAFRVFFARLADLRVLAAALVLAIVAAALVGDGLLPGLALLAGVVRDQRVDPTFNAVACAIAGLAVEFGATLAMGALFPLLVRLAEDDAGGAGRAVGPRLRVEHRRLDPRGDRDAPAGDAAPGRGRELPARTRVVRRRARRAAARRSAPPARGARDGRCRRGDARLPAAAPRPARPQPGPLHVRHGRAARARHPAARCSSRPARRRTCSSRASSRTCCRTIRARRSTSAR